jgi:hypothetical protein
MYYDVLWYIGVYWSILGSVEQYRQIKVFCKFLKVKIPSFDPPKGIKVPVKIYLNT